MVAGASGVVGELITQTWPSVDHCCLWLDLTYRRAQGADESIERGRFHARRIARSPHGHGTLLARAHLPALDVQVAQESELIRRQLQRPLPKKEAHAPIVVAQKGARGVRRVRVDERELGACFAQPAQAALNATSVSVSSPRRSRVSRMPGSMPEFTCPSRSSTHLYSRWLRIFVLPSCSVSVIVTR